MAIDSMNETSYYQLEKYLNTNPYREYAMNKPYIPKPISISSRTNQQQNKSSFITFHPLIINQKDSPTLDRNTYKLRMKSNLNVDTLREQIPHRLPRRHYYHRPNHTNVIVNDKFSSIIPSASTKAFTRQPTAVTRTTMKTTVTGIEGNAVRVATLHDLIDQFHDPTESSDNASTSVSTKPVINGRSTPKPSERIIKQPQALTEYHFNAPSSSRTYRKTDPIDSPPLLADQYGQRLNTTTSSHDKRIQESREKILLHTEKQMCICNKLTIIDPFNSEQNHLISPLIKRPAVRYIFPPVRPIGYFTRKTTDDLLRSIPKKNIKNKRQDDSIDSYDQVSIDDEDSLHLFNHANKSRASITSDIDDDLRNPPNTTVNMNLKHDKHS